jgi:hypothetical protein
MLQYRAMTTSKWKRILVAAALTSLIAQSITLGAEQTLAFPSAEGFGANIEEWLNDTDPRRKL